MLWVMKETLRASEKLQVLSSSRRRNIWSITVMTATELRWGPELSDCTSTGKTELSVVIYGLRES